MQKRPHGATPMRGKIAAAKVNFRNVEIDLRDSTALPRCGYTYQIEGLNDGDVR